VQAVSYEQALAAYGGQTAASPSGPSEAAYEIWTARMSDFSSRGDAIGAMTLARTQLLSSQPGHVLPPQLHRSARDWTNPAAIASAPIARAVASLPIGGVSGVIEDNAGWHLVRVVARRNAPPLPQPAAPARAHAGQSVSYEQSLPPQRGVSPPAGNAAAGRMGPQIIALRQANCNCR
jgi:hypothetical protein